MIDAEHMELHSHLRKAPDTIASLTQTSECLGTGATLYMHAYVLDCCDLPESKVYILPTAGRLCHVPSLPGAPIIHTFTALLSVHDQDCKQMF